MALNRPRWGRLWQKDKF